MKRGLSTFRRHPEITRIVIAATPLLFVIALLALFIFPVKFYVQCETLGCVPITTPESLERILVLDEPKSREVIESDTPDIKQTKKIKEHERTGLIYGGRLTFLFFAVTYFAVCAFAFGIGCFVIAKSFASETKKPIRWTLVFAAISGGAGVTLYMLPDLYMRIFKPLFQMTISHDLGAAFQLMRFASSFGFSVALLLVFASCAVLYSRDSGSSENALKHIAAQMKHLRLILYVGTFMLVTGVLLIRSVFNWSVAFLMRDEQVIKIADKFFSDLTAIEGAYFTLILALVYLPAAFILQKRAESLSDLPTLETEREKVLTDYGLGFSLTQSLPRVLAILGPLLAGPVGELLSRAG